jgi:hypothetical protein
LLQRPKVRPGPRGARPEKRLRSVLAAASEQSAQPFDFLGGLLEKGFDIPDQHVIGVERRVAETARRSLGSTNWFIRGGISNVSY